MQPRTGLCVVLLVAAVAGVTTIAATPVSGQTGVIAQQGVVDADETADSAVVWDNESTGFVTGEPQVVLTTSRGGLTPGMLIGVIMVILLAGVSGWFYQRRPSNTDDGPSTTGIDTDADTETNVTTHTGASPTDSDADTQQPGRQNQTTTPSEHNTTPADPGDCRGGGADETTETGGDNADGANGGGQ